MDKILGLPAHPLLVHAAVILVPLAAVAIAAIGWKAEWRRAYLLPVMLLALSGGVFAFLAKTSGEPVEKLVRTAANTQGAARPRFGDHPEQGDTAMFFAIVLALAAVAFWAIERWGKRWNLPSWAPMAAYAAVLIPAALATLTMFVAGHSGAQLVWKDVGSFAAGR